MSAVENERIESVLGEQLTNKPSSISLQNTEPTESRAEQP